MIGSHEPSFGPQTTARAVAADYQRAFAAPLCAYRQDNNLASLAKGNALWPCLVLRHITFFGCGFSFAFNRSLKFWLRSQRE